MNHLLNYKIENPKKVPEGLSENETDFFQRMNYQMPFIFNVSIRNLKNNLTAESGANEFEKAVINLTDVP